MDPESEGRRPVDDASPALEHVEVPALEDCTPYGYSQCVRGPDGMIYVAGQCGLGDDHEVVSLDFTEQATRAIERLRLCLESAGAGLDDVISMTVFVTDIRDARTFTSLRRSVFNEPYPVSALVEVGHLVPRDAKVEIQAIAVDRRARGKE